MTPEFMLYIRNAGDAKKALTPEEHLAFIKKCEVYIGQLKAKDQLIAAQPIVREGFVITRDAHGWKKRPVDPLQEVQVGYYHIKANSMEEAITIAKGNPEFEYVPSASIEVRPIKLKEEQTKFVYPGEDKA
ncbi:MAG: YciI family protein [Mucilaginibacter sp.]